MTVLIDVRCSLDAQRVFNEMVSVAHALALKAVLSSGAQQRVEAQRGGAAGACRGRCEFGAALTVSGDDAH